MRLEAAQLVLLADARAGAAAAVAQARRESDAVIEDARAEAAKILAEARAEGESAAGSEAARELGRARRRARERVLQERGLAFEQLRSNARAAVLAMRSEPAYDRLLDRLEELARSSLGPGAEIERDPGGLGGVRAGAGRRSVDLTLEALVDRCLVELAGELEAGWR